MEEVVLHGSPLLGTSRNDWGDPEELLLAKKTFHIHATLAVMVAHGILFFFSLPEFSARERTRGDLQRGILSPLFQFPLSVPTRVKP